MATVETPPVAELKINLHDPETGVHTQTVAYGVPGVVNVLIDVAEDERGFPTITTSLGGMTVTDEAKTITALADLLTLVADSAREYANTL
jgi:hypothetical protein